jgi:uncharacterized protein YukE
MRQLPAFSIPPGDPSALRPAVHRLHQTASATRDISKRLGGTNADVARVWQSDAQRVFSVLSSTWVEIASTAANIMERYGDALHRYALSLERAQSEVHQAHQRLQALAAATPVGVPLDAATLASIEAQVRQAGEAARSAGAELASASRDLIGPVSTDQLPARTAATEASFVNRSHTVASNLSAAAIGRNFDAQAAKLNERMHAVHNGLLGLSGRQGVPAPSATMVVGPSAMSGGTIVFTAPPAQQRSGATVTVGPSQLRNPASTAMAVIGPMRSGNPALSLMQAATDIQKRNALRIWERAFPGVAPPDTHAGGILREILSRGGSNLDPSILAATSMVGDAVAYSNHTAALPHGWSLVRRTYR